MNRTFIGFELSKDYARLGRKRLKLISIGDKLDGADEPTMRNIEQIEKRKKKSKKDLLENPFPDEETIHIGLSSELLGIVEAFASSNRGFSVDRVVVDPVLNEDFQLACDRLFISGTSAERNRHLFRMRKAGKFKSFNINTKIRTKIDWGQVGPFIYASEIAWRKMSNLTNLSLDNIFCDPRYASQFDGIASKFAPGFQPLEYRWAALKLRKEGSQAKQRASQRTPRQFGISGFNEKGLVNEKSMDISELKKIKIKPGPAVYLIRELDGTALYAGETSELTNCFKRMFDDENSRKQWLEVGEDLQVFTRSLQSVTDYRFARQSHLLKWHKPKWNTVETFS